MLGISWALFGAENAGRIAMLAIAMLWVISIHLTASRRDRSTAAATLSCLFILNHMVYWGFYSFEIGWPAFLIWFSLNAEGSSDRFSLRDALLWLGCALLLPDKYMNTIRFDQRRMSPAMIMLLLTVPTPIVRPLSWLLTAFRILVGVGAEAPEEIGL